MCEFCEETNFKRVDGYEKGKKYTKRTKSISYSRDYELNEVNGMILVLDEDRENRLYFDNSSWEYARGYIKINYCPMCGKGNEDWNYSAPHGAGRTMSRSKAKESVSLEEYQKTMNGIFTTSVNTYTIDESPMAYKTMDEIIGNIKDTVEIVDIIKPIYNFKANE